MAASNMVVGRLDLAARAIDLTNVLLKATTSSGFLVKGAWEIGQWLGRERLNQFELLDCMEKAKGLVFANKQGQRFFDEIICGLDIKPVGPLFLQHSGSLGRLMAGDPNLSWVVSTVACLFQHHRDDRVVTEMLTAFIMVSHRSHVQEQSFNALDSFTYNPEQTRLRAVVRKIVSSVWYNVVNAGCDTIPLPRELLEICRRGHYLDPADFGIVINIIYARCPSKAILRPDHLLRDVVLWLLLHYDGTVIVNVGGEIVYQANLGNPLRELEVHVASACSESRDCFVVGKESYQILRHISGKFEEFLSGCSFSSFSDVPPHPGVRQKLYDITRPYPRDSAMRNKGLQIMVKCSAQSIMRWLLSVPLAAQKDFSAPGFSAEPERSGADCQTTVYLVLKRIPAIINLQWGSWANSQIVFDNQLQTISDSNSIEDAAEWVTDRRLDTLFEYFPILTVLVAKVSADCMCSDCSSLKDRDIPDMKTDGLRPGCLKRTALEEVLLLLAHGIADGFGVNDTSSVSEVTSTAEGMLVILLEMVQERKVCWDTWFSVASCVFMGCPFVEPVPPNHPAFGGTAFAAIQYGNLATQAPWLDLNQELVVRGCFGLLGSKGRLGVITKNDDHYAQFRSVEENFAIIETENTEDVTSFCSRNKKTASSVDHHLHLDDDESPVESDVILCQMDDKFYRLLLRVKTRNHRRIVDPSDALSAVIRVLPFARCPHVSQPPKMHQYTVKIYTIDEILGRWPDTVQSQVPTSTAPGYASQNSGTIHMSEVLDTYMKKNIALALSVCSVAIPNYPKLSCPACTLAWSKRAQRLPLRDGEGGNSKDRYIINLKIRLADQQSTMLRQLIEGPNAPTDGDLQQDAASRQGGA